MTYRVEVVGRPVRTLRPWFVSVTIDTSVLIGGSWWGPTRRMKAGLSVDTTPPLDLAHPDLARWAAPLAPTLLRIGGTEADRIGYGFRHDGPPGPVERPEQTFVLKGALWKKVNRWAEACGFRLLFTVSAGPGARDARGRWRPEEAARLLRHSRRKGYPIAGWEFGNEVNAFPLFHGARHPWTRRQYVEDFAAFATLVRQEFPGTAVVGPGSAVWPLVGEPNPVIPALGRSDAAGHLDALSFHYYPQQSSRGPVAVRRAKEGTLLSARALEGPRRWIRHARRALARGPKPLTPLWVTETGHALYGGEPGLSDTWLSTPWWLDQLGLMAHEGVEAVFRQSLVGSDYGLLSEGDFVPRPDYWATLLFKKKMGDEVLTRPVVSGRDRRLRAWAHRSAGGTTVLLINLHPQRPVKVDLGAASWEAWVLGPESEGRSSRVVLNGRMLEGALGLRLVDAPGEPGSGPVVLPPLACAFVRLLQDGPA